MSKHPLKGSERTPLAGAKAVGKIRPDERLEVTILVRARSSEALESRARELAAGTRPNEHFTREDFAQRFGADPSDIAAIEQFAQDHGIAVVQENTARRTVILSGTVAQFNTAFDVDLQRFEHAGGSYRGRTGAVHIPDALNGIVEAVLGLDNRPQARPHFRARPLHGNVRWRALADSSASFTPLQLASLYDFPRGDGRGECIGIIELGGGYRTADVQTYFSELNIRPPKISSVSVDHGSNNPTGDPNGPDGEVMLDMEVAGAIAPGASIVVYFAPNTDAGFLNAVTTAIHDTVNKPSILSISWGGAEPAWTAQALQAFDRAFQEAAALGITICAASGDNGSSDGIHDGACHVDFPASSPFVLACGGTRLQAVEGEISTEIAWNEGINGGASGGGESNVFDLPAWQQGLAITNHRAKQILQKRGVPDVAADADPQTGYDVRIDGNKTVFGGTSAVAPLWAGLIARINAAQGRPCGYINPLLYGDPRALNDITEGNNGDFSASGGWDATTGLGSPNGEKIAALLGRVLVGSASR